MGTPRFIQLSKYLKHYAVWQSCSTNEFGDTSVTTSETISCLYYTGSNYRSMGNQTSGAARVVQNLELEHLALLYSTPAIQVNDRLTAIVNQDGETLVASARVVRVESYHHWDTGRGLLMKQVTLDFS